MGLSHSALVESKAVNSTVKLVLNFSPYIGFSEQRTIEAQTQNNCLYTGSLADTLAYFDSYSSPIRCMIAIACESATPSHFL